MCSFEVLSISIEGFPVVMTGQTAAATTIPGHWKSAKPTEMKE